MKPTTPLFVALVALLFSSTLSHAGSSGSSLDQKLRFEFGAATAGPTIKASNHINDFWAIRAFHGFGITDYSYKIRGRIRYQEKADLAGTSLNLDVYPFRNRL